MTGVFQEKLEPQDDLWNVKAQEHQITRRLDTEIGNIEGAINLASRMMALKASPGWQSFVKALEDCRVYRRQELELCTGTDSEMRVIQGRCRELGAVLSLMKQTEQNTQVLASRLETLQAEKAAFIRSDGKVKPKGVFST